MTSTFGMAARIFPSTCIVAAPLEMTQCINQQTHCELKCKEFITSLLSTYVEHEWKPMQCMKITYRLPTAHIVKTTTREGNV